MKRAGIIPSGLTHPGDVEWTENAGKTPGRKHQAIDRSDILGSKVVSGEGRHSAESAAVTHQYDEGDGGHHLGNGDFRKKPKEQDLHYKYQGEGYAPGGKIRYPGPKDAADSIAEAGDPNHTAGNHCAHAREFLKDGRFLRDHRDAGRDVQK